MSVTVSTFAVADTGNQRWKDQEEFEMALGIPGICISDEGKIYVTDCSNNRIMIIVDRVASTFAGCGEVGHKDGEAHKAMFNYPTGICISDDDKIYVADTTNNCIRMIYDGMVSTIAGKREAGWRDGKVAKATFDHPTGVFVSFSGTIYVADKLSSSVRMISNGKVSTIAGSGEQGHQDGCAFEEALFYGPTDICTLDDENLYVADHENNCIRLISNGTVSTIAGCPPEMGHEDGEGEESMFDGPYRLCMSDLNHLYITDQYNHCIRMISDDVVSTIAGCGCRLQKWKR